MQLTFYISNFLMPALPVIFIFRQVFKSKN